MVGQLCDALHASHLELAAWTGPQLVRALNDDMSERGITWPNEIVRPGPFLAHRLRNLPARPAPPVQVRAVSVTEAVDAAALSPGPRTAVEPSPARLEAQRSIREVLSRRRRHPHTGS
ncbi:hypothetical protein DVS77_27475 [Mycolicibacterium moriokaense]|nr:hypothetical protein DVS77_27475 [Mycolicibacterium moriokaense]